jgi:hypothetical protein
MALRSSGMGVQVTWATLPGKPSVFAPAAHTHVWGEITGKPSAYPPAAHTHSWADITDRPTIPAATPLGTTAALALAAAASAGSSANAAREDHAHPLPSGRDVFIGNANINRTLLLALGSGMTREFVTLTNVPTGTTPVASGDRLLLVATAPCSAGCEPINVYPDNNRVLLAYNTPQLGIGAVVNVQTAVYRIT